MDADSTQVTPLPGSYIPIRAPLTIDSDSEFSISNYDHIYSRTSSFNSTNSSIDISSYTDEQISVREEENHSSLAHPDEEIVIQRSNVKEFAFTRPFVKYPDENCVKENSDFDKANIFRAFVKYPDENCVKESSHFDKANIFRAFVKIPCEESSSNTKLSVPVARLTSECDSDVDSVDDGPWLNSESAPVDRIVERVNMSPKGTIFSEDEEDNECDDVSGVDELSDSMKGFVSAESIEDECKVECLSEVVKLSKSDYVSFDSERIDGHISPSSSNDNEIETMDVKLLESGELSFDLESLDAQLVSVSNNESEIETDDLNYPESSELGFASEKIDPQIVSDLNNHIEIEPEQELVFDSYKDEFKKTLIEKEEETQPKLQPIRSKFLSLALMKQLTTQVNGDGTNNNFDSHLTILVIGKTGVGKSATINSIFGQKKALTNAFEPGTTTIQSIIGNVDGIRLEFIDTPGFSCSPFERSYNKKVLKSIKRFTRKHTPDVVLYVDRLDTHTREDNDSQVLRLITSSLGYSVWSNCIIVLTHAGSSFKDELSDGFVFQRCRLIQEQIVKFGGSNMQMTNPVWLVENNVSCKRDDINLDVGLEGLVCLDQTDEDQYDQVSPIDPLSESEEAIRSSLGRKKACFEEYVYRVKFLGSKHWSVACRFRC